MQPTLADAIKKNRTKLVPSFFLLSWLPKWIYASYFFQ